MTVSTNLFWLIFDSHYFDDFWTNLLCWWIIFYVTFNLFTIIIYYLATCFWGIINPFYIDQPLNQSILMTLWNDLFWWPFEQIHFDDTSNQSILMNHLTILFWSVFKLVRFKVWSLNLLWWPFKSICFDDSLNQFIVRPFYSIDFDDFFYYFFSYFDDSLNIFILMTHWTMLFWLVFE